MREWKITYKRVDANYNTSAIKWAQDKNSAIKLISKRLPSKDGVFSTKRGELCQLIDIQDITKD